MKNSLKANFQAKIEGIAEQKALDKAYKDARDKKSGQNKQLKSPNKVGSLSKKSGSCQILVTSERRLARLASKLVLQLTTITQRQKMTTSSL